MRYLLTGLLLIGLAMLAMTMLGPRRPDSTRRTAPLRADDASSQLARTTVAATLDEPHRAGHNLLWCATFQLAWGRLAELFGEPPRLDGDPPLARRLADGLDHDTGLAESSYVAVGGIGERALEEIRQRLARLGQSAAPPRLLPSHLDDDQALAFAWLRIALAWDPPLQPARHGLRFGDSLVSAFGLWDDGDEKLWRRRSRQVVVHRFLGRDDFVVELRAAGSHDGVIVARLVPGDTLGDTTAAVMGRLDDDSEASSPKPTDHLVVPRLDFDLTRRYGELAGRRVANPGYTEVVLAAAAQNVRFRLDEQGARVESSGAAVLELAAPVPQPRRMICDGPFLVALRHRGAPRPYFALWVENDELLVRN